VGEGSNAWPLRRWLPVGEAGTAVLPARREELVRLVCPPPPVCLSSTTVRRYRCSLSPQSPLWALFPAGQGCPRQGPSAVGALDRSCLCAVLVLPRPSLWLRLQATCRRFVVVILGGGIASHRFVVCWQLVEPCLLLCFVGEMGG
jgi:hypothetical protein